MQEKPLSFDLVHPNPLMIVISGPSGVGKDSVVKALMRRNPEFYFVVTTTSREPRENEIEGLDYHFVTKAEFEQLIAANGMIEFALVYDQYKGAAKQRVSDALASGKDVLVRVDVQGAKTYRALFPEALLIFLLPTSPEELIYRLRDRCTETEESIALRMATTRNELEYLPIFDYIVYNPAGKLDEAVENLEAIIRAEHHRVKQRKVEL
jgi:guanylate kinase